MASVPLLSSSPVFSSPSLPRRNSRVVSCSSIPARKNASLQRRDLVLLGMASNLFLSGPSSGTSLLPGKNNLLVLLSYTIPQNINQTSKQTSSDLLAVVISEQDAKMNMFADDINAYSYLYPIELPNKSPFKWVVSRKPERYSSAAPLSPNARQRIVSERVDITHNSVISVSIGPPNSRFLTSNDKSTWKAGDVADSVLSDKSALVTGQRMVESSILDAHSDNVEGEPYWYYEYIVRKSPTISVQEPNLFRHNLAVTAERDGYLYSLNASTLSKQWDQIGPFLEQAVASFRLKPPTENYVPPFKDPWRFW